MQKEEKLKAMNVEFFATRNSALAFYFIEPSPCYAVVLMPHNVLHKTSKGMREINYQNITQIERTTILKLPTKTFIGFMRCYRQLFPSIKFVKEIPQWIISSDVAAYHPYSKTIWIRSNLGLKTIPTLIHELTHWFIHVFLKNNNKFHNKIDKK